MVGWLRRRRARRQYEREVSALWKPQYDALAQYNTARMRGLVHDSATVKRMEAVQSDYDENYMVEVARLREALND